jgi:hypothetical protein
VTAITAGPRFVTTRTCQIRNSDGCYALADKEDLLKCQCAPVTAAPLPEQASREELLLRMEVGWLCVPSNLTDSFREVYAFRRPAAHGRNLSSGAAPSIRLFSSLRRWHECDLCVWTL